MQLNRISTGAALLRDFLSSSHRFILPDQQAVIMAIGAQVGVVVLDDQQFSEAHNTGTGVYHDTIGDRIDGIAPLATDINALVDTG